MSNRPKKWPDYALGSLEGALMHLKVIDDMAKQLYEAAKRTEQSEFANLSNDIRARSIDARSLLHQARTGDYET